TRKAVVPVNDDGIHEPLPADRHQLVEGWSSFPSAADSLVHVLYGDLETPALTELAQLSKLHFGILSMVQSADSGIQSHTFRCPLFSSAVRDHASTNPASFSPWARPQAKRCSTTKAPPNHHRASGWTCSSIHCLPWEVRGQNKKTVPSLRTRTSGVFGTSCDELLMDACSFGRTRIR